MQDEYILKSEAIKALGDCPEVVTESDYQAVCYWNRYRDRIQAIEGVLLEDDGK